MLRLVEYTRFKTGSESVAECRRLPRTRLVQISRYATNPKARPQLVQWHLSVVCAGVSLVVGTLVHRPPRHPSILFEFHPRPPAFFHESQSFSFASSPLILLFFFSMCDYVIGMGVCEKQTSIHSFVTPVSLSYDETVV